MTRLSQDASFNPWSEAHKAAPRLSGAARLGTESPPGAQPATPDLRDFFAAAALQGLLSRDAGRNTLLIRGYESRRAIDAYRIADEMLKAR